MLGHTMMEAYPGIENSEMFVHLRRCMEERVPHHMENMFTYPDGSQGWFELSIEPVPEGAFILSLDVTGRKRAETELKHDADIQSAINSLLRMSLTDLPLQDLLCQALDIILGIPWLSHEGRGVVFLVEDEQPEVLVMKAHRGLPEPMVMKCAQLPFGKCLCGQTASTGQVQFADRLDRRHDIVYDGMAQHGHYCVPIHIAGSVVGVFSLYMAEGHRYDEAEAAFLQAVADVLAGIIERRRALDKVLESLREKEVLLREVHHRVKNNLQVVSSLLRLQSGHVKDANALQMFRATEERVRSMALVHEQLYRSPALSSIDFGTFVREICQRLVFSYAADPAAVTLTLDVEDVDLGIDLAIPCGLVINELVTNALLHGLAGGKGKIGVSLKSHGNDYVLIISDDGTGFPRELDFRHTESLGMQLVMSLTRQLQGSISLDREEGTQWKIMFKSRE